MQLWVGKVIQIRRRYVPTPTALSSIAKRLNAPTTRNNAWLIVLMIRRNTMPLRNTWTSTLCAMIFATEKPFLDRLNSYPPFHIEIQPSFVSHPVSSGKMFTFRNVFSRFRLISTGKPVWAWTTSSFLQMLCEQDEEILVNIT